MKTNSFWEQHPYPRDFQSLKENIKTDILIIGGGMTGLLTAYELMNRFDSVVIVEQNKIYQGTTSSTTAKITYQHGYIYTDLINLFGEKNARYYYRFNKAGMDEIEDIINTHHIDCDYQKVNGYLFASNEQENESVKKEYEAYKQLGINGEITKIDERITPFNALKTENQANFNISKFLKALTDILISKNVKIYEGTRIVDTYGYEKAYAKTEDDLLIEAKHIIIANHYPIYKGFNFYFMRMIPQISYSVVSKPTAIDIENANYINTSDPAIAIRYIKGEEGERYLNISGATHDAKEFKQNLGQINILKSFGENHFGFSQDDYDYTWCAQDYCTTDYVPLVGRARNRFYIAASYHEWGMAASAGAALLIRDLITGTGNEYSDFFNPNRVTFNKKLFSYNLKMIGTLLKTRHIPKTSPLIGPAGTGKVVKIGGKRIGLYKDENQELIVVDVTCPHMRCGLRFNPLEKTYDCKCHGSRFSYEGKLLDGPSRRNLYRLDFEDLKKYFHNEDE